MCEFSKVCELYSVWSRGTVLYIKWANKFNVGYPELIVLYALETRDKLTQRVITEEFGLLKPTVNTVIHDLKKRGVIFLEPCEKDKREKLVIFTEQGQQYADKIIQPLLKVEQSIGKKIGNARMQETLETIELFNLLFEKEIERGIK